jgi:hypothetical protein
VRPSKSTYRLGSSNGELEKPSREKNSISNWQKRNIGGKRNGLCRWFCGNFYVAFHDVVFVTHDDDVFEYVKEL